MPAYVEIRPVVLPDPIQQTKPLLQQRRFRGEEEPTNIHVADSGDATRAQHAPQLREGPHWLAQVLQHPIGKRRVEGASGNGKS